MISKNLNVQINLIFSLISINDISCSLGNKTWPFHNLFLWFFCLNFKTFAISNFCNTGILYLEHLLSRTFAISNFFADSFKVRDNERRLYGKKLIDTAAKTGIDAEKTASKQVVQKTVEATGNVIGNKIADKITSLGKTKSEEKEDERQENYISPEKRQQIVDDLRLLWHYIKMKHQKITKL